VYVALATFRKAMQLVSELGELDGTDAFAAVVLPGLSALIGCDVATYNELGHDPAHVHYCDFPAMALDRSTHDVFAAHVQEHPLVNHYRQTCDGRPVRISDFISQARFHNLVIYQDFFRRIPVEHQLAMTLAEPDATVIGVALNRGAHDFSDADRDVLTVMRPPLAAALLRIRLRKLAATADGPALTAGERHILDLVAAGGTNVAIARALGNSPRTVAKHLEHIYRKLGVSSRSAAVARTRARLSGSASNPAER
jgi:DNA-binding CsgD family transcriptional regulator